MRLQQALALEPRHNGRIEYFERNGKFSYYFGYDANSWVRIESDTNQSMWSQETIAKSVAIFKEEIEGPKSEVGVD